MRPSVSLFFVAVAALLSASYAAKKFTFTPSNLPPRFQWESNYGYCGEVSTIQALLKYGGYVSQYDLRAISFPDAVKPQSRNEYLVGENDGDVAESLDLAYEQYSSKGKSGEDYLAWIKSQVRLDRSVTITVYMNQRTFYGDRDEDAGEKEYDHIVVVTSLSSDHDDDLYHADDVIEFDDHGLYDPAGGDDDDRPYDPKAPPQYLWEQTFGDILRTRQEANAVLAPPYSISSVVENYGLAHSGLQTFGWESVSVATNYCFENPAIHGGSDTRPTSMPLSLSVPATGLSSSYSYTLFKFDDESKVPRGGDLESLSRKNAVETWDLPTPDETVVIKDDIKSSDKAFYRCLRTDDGVRMDRNETKGF